MLTMEETLISLYNNQTVQRRRNEYFACSRYRNYLRYVTQDLSSGASLTCRVRSIQGLVDVHKH